ncbi:MAG: 2Fe-2S iron-sulfur cluster binding domain-containing protein, partial [Emcibacter sp.]|nr:2Fe-2S iron-sulfur cluster binding domain-containing protein [Emcibacter sp.]
QQVHFENFGADVDVSGDSFVVKALKSNKTVVVEEGETIVAALARVGIEVDVSCEQGICGECLTPVISGRPDHRDMYQTDEEKSTDSQMTLCCSRALTDELTLDL